MNKDINQNLDYFNESANSIIKTAIEKSNDLTFSELIDSLQDEVTKIGKRITDNENLNIQLHFVDEKLNSYTVYDGEEYVMSKDLSGKDVLKETINETLIRNYNEALMNFESQIENIIKESVKNGQKTVTEICDNLTTAYQEITKDTDNEILLLEANRHCSYALTKDNSLDFYNEEDYINCGLVPEKANEILMYLEDEMMSSEEWENQEREEETSL